jgi:hypothetical protein
MENFSMDDRQLGGLGLDDRVDGPVWVDFL